MDMQYSRIIAHPHISIVWPNPIANGQSVNDVCMNAPGQGFILRILGWKDMMETQ